MNKYKTVNEFLQDQPNDKLEQINLIRQVITTTQPKLTESLKWNAPNYSLNGDDRITFNLMNKEGRVKLILHMGATKKEDKNAKPVLESDEGIMEWSSDIRGTISFTDADDVRAKQIPLTKVIKAWLAL